MPATPRSNCKQSFPMATAVYMRRPDDCIGEGRVGTGKDDSQFLVETLPPTDFS